VPNAPADADEPGRAFLITAYVVLFLGGAVLGLFGALLLPHSADSAVTTTVPTGGSGAVASSAAAHVMAAGGGAGQVLSLGILFALIFNPLLSWAGLRMAGTRLAAFTPLAGWLLVVLPLASGRSSGTVVLPSGARSFGFLLVGALAFTAVAAIGKPTRGMSVLLGQPLNATPAPTPRPAPKPPARQPAAAKRKAGGPRTGSKGGKRR
jgi:hypothetical protein